MIINGTESVSKSWLNQIYWSSNANMPAASYSTGKFFLIYFNRMRKGNHFHL